MQEISEKIILCRLLMNDVDWEWILLSWKNFQTASLLENILLRSLFSSTEFTTTYKGEFDRPRYKHITKRKAERVDDSDSQEWGKNLRKSSKIYHILEFSNERFPERVKICYDGPTMTVVPRPNTIISLYDDTIHKTLFDSIVQKILLLFQSLVKIAME